MNFIFKDVWQFLLFFGVNSICSAWHDFHLAFIVSFPAVKKDGLIITAE